MLICDLIILFYASIVETDSYSTNTSTSFSSVSPDSSTKHLLSPDFLSELREHLTDIPNQISFDSLFTQADRHTVKGTNKITHRE